MPVVGWQIVDKPPYLSQAEDIIWQHKMSHTAFLAVNLGAAKFLCADVLVRNGLDHIWAGNKHVGGILNHKSEIGHGRAVHGTTGAWSHDA